LASFSRSCRQLGVVLLAELLADGLELLLQDRAPLVVGELAVHLALDLRLELHDLDLVAGELGDRGAAAR
jgi:hypothetical protein